MIRDVIHATQRRMTEWSFPSDKAYANPFNDVTFDVILTDPNGREHTIPAFWAGEETWRVRYAPPESGTYCYRTACSDTSNPSLHGREDTMVAAPYDGTNPILRRGGLRVSADRRFLE